MSPAELVIVLNSKHIPRPFELEDSERIPDSFGESQNIAQTLSMLNESALSCFGMSEHQVKILPKDWQSVPGVMSWIEGLDLPQPMKEHQPLYLRRALRNLIAAGKTHFEAAATEILAPLYRYAFEKEGFDPTFLICTHFSEKESPTLQGIRLKYLMNALLGTIGAKRLVDGPIPVAHDDLPATFREVLAIAHEASRDPDGFQNGIYDDQIRHLAHDIEVLDQIANAVDLPESRLKVWWKEGRAELPYAPTGSWQTLTVPIDVRKGTEVGIQVYDVPCRISIRRAAWLTESDQVDILLSPHQLEMYEDADGIKLSGLGYLTARVPNDDIKALKFELFMDASDSTLGQLVRLESLDERPRIGKGGRPGT